MIDELFLVLTRIVLRLCPPLQAYAILTRLGALLPPHDDLSDVLRVRNRVRGRGSCLSRALAVAARAPQVDLVIGVTPRPNMPLFAHAWLELAGMPIDPSDVAGSEIARIRGTGRCEARS